LRKRLRLICCLAIALLSGCSRIEPPQESGTLVVAVREAPAFFARTGDTAQGFEHDLVTAFADSLGLKVNFVPATDPFELNDLALAGRVHMAASMPVGTGAMEYSTPIRTVAQWVVGHSDALGPDDLAGLAGRSVEVVAGSPLADTLRGLEEKMRPRVIEVPRIDEMGLLARVAERKAQLVAVHEIHLDLAANFHPDLRPLLRLPGKLEFGWAFGSDDAETLRAKADAFIENARADGTLARLHDRYFGHIKRIKTALPNWRQDFHVAQDLTGIDWRLLAALAYQESKWDPLATSPTGVRGMMMLTEDTADHLGVKNRLDPKESIRAGARYLNDLIDLIPASVTNPDRQWLALAAYNLGMGHLRGARAIAASMQRNPDVWFEMKQVLPLLARPSVYARLKSGKARGGEAVIMVENIRTYYDILVRFEPPRVTPYAAKPGAAKLTQR